VNASNPTTGETQWTYATPHLSPTLTSYYNQWIWVFPFSVYQQGQLIIGINSQAEQSLISLGDRVLEATLLSYVPLPFGETFALQQPVVSSVNPTCVFPGHNFTINGTGLYPSLVSNVLIDGATSKFTSLSDTQIKVVAPGPALSPQPIVVQTGVGQSNSNVSIEIPYLYCP
jgi:hypothetical protein